MKEECESHVLEVILNTEIAHVTYGFMDTKSPLLLGTKVVNNVHAQLNSTEHAIYPAHNVK